MPPTIRNPPYPEAAVHRIQASFTGKLIIALLCAATFLAPTRAADNNALKTIDYPGGGQILYGPLPDQSTLKDAMVSMLRNIHGHFGDRPVIGSLFQTHGSDSLATFFTVTAKNQGGKHIAGLVIVAMPNGSKPAAGVIYDDANQFSKTLNPMMKKLNEVWHVDTTPGPASGAAASGKAAPVAELHQTTFPDNSGTIGLPTGWKIIGGRGGAVVVSGPNGEIERLSQIHAFLDPSTPQGQKMIQFETQNGRRPLPDQFTAYPYGRDLVESFRAYLQQASQRSKIPTPTFTVTSTTKVAPSQNSLGGLSIVADLDLHDGSGMRTALFELSPMKRIDPSGWSFIATVISVPKKFAQEEWPTMLAVANSMKQNGAVIQAQTQQTINHIHAIGAASKAQADAAHASNDAHNASVEAHWDNMARASKSFQEYTLDQSVIVDKSTGEHATAWNQTADLLVKADPNRFQYVPNKDLLKGTDY
jgi:hypothetical protein